MYNRLRDMHVLDLRDLKADLLEQRKNLDRRITRINNLIAHKLVEGKADDHGNS